MAVNIHTNVTSLQAQRFLGANSMAQAKNVQKLSSGFRINSASDDAAGLAISEEMRADLRSMQQAGRNANDAVSMIQTAEASMGDVSSILGRLRELAMQSASDGVTDTQRGYIDTERTELVAEIDRIAGDVEYNGIALLDGTLSAEFQIGLDSGDTITVDQGTAIDSAGLGVDATDFLTRTDAEAALALIDTAIESVSGFRASFGAKQNRMESVTSNIQVSYENLSAANGRIRDVDVASEMAALTKNQILVQASTAMLSQANAFPQTALSLLG
ncbi:MAG: flagellin [Bradymonadia bacterium]|jgi:flagellin